MNLTPADLRRAAVLIRASITEDGDTAAAILEEAIDLEHRPLELLLAVLHIIPMLAPWLVLPEGRPALDATIRDLVAAEAQETTR